jgi:mRNA interferase MazF
VSRLVDFNKFDEWNEIKKSIENNQFIYTKNAEIYNALIGQNVGFEQSGKGEKFFRPILIFKVFSQYTALAIPLSTTKRRGKYYFEFSFIENKTSVALLSQIRLIDTRRLYKKMGRMNKKDFQNMKEKFYEL